MKKSLLKHRNGPLFSAVTAVVIVVLLIANIFLAYLGQNRMIFADLTPEGLYTLTGAMKSECDFVDELDGDKTVEILFCTDPDYLIGSTISRIPYYMSVALANRYDNVKVDTVNVLTNPTAVAAYKTTSLSEIKSDDVIISYGDRYKIVSVSSFWRTNSDGNIWSYDGEYKMASILKSITAKSQPSAYFVTDHGETYYDVNNPTSEMSIKSAYLYDLLTERGLNVKTLSLKELVNEGKDIPDECVLLIINNPREDFTYSEDSLDDLFAYTETDVIDRYLVKNAGAVMVAKDFELTLPVFEQFMHEWGFDFGTSLVKDEVASGGALSGPDNSGGLGSNVIGQYNRDEQSYAYAIYEEYARLSSAPRFVFSNAGYIVCSYDDATGKNEDGTHKTSRYYSSLFSTSSSAKAYFKNEFGEYTGLLDKDKGVKDIAAVATRIYTDSVTSEYTYSYMFCANSKDFFSNELLSNDSYANFGVISLLVDNISRIDEYASIELGGSSMNSTSYAGKHLRDSSLSEISVKIYAEDAKTVIKENRGISSAEIVVFSIIPFAVALAVLVVGVVVRVKRRYL